MVTRPDTTQVTVNDLATSTAGNNFTGGNTGNLKSQATHAEAGEAFDGIKDAREIQTEFDKDFMGYIRDDEILIWIQKYRQARSFRGDDGLQSKDMA